jgi:hypothetical protein
MKEIIKKLLRAFFLILYSSILKNTMKSRLYLISFLLSKEKLYFYDIFS